MHALQYNAPAYPLLGAIFMRFLLKSMIFFAC